MGQFLEPPPPLPSSVIHASCIYPPSVPSFILHQPSSLPLSSISLRSSPVPRFPAADTPCKIAPGCQFYDPICRPPAISRRLTGSPLQRPTARTTTGSPLTASIRPYPTQASEPYAAATMKLHYIGVNDPSMAPRSALLGRRLADQRPPLAQIIRNESKPAHEICAEKELSAYSRFTRNKCAPHSPYPTRLLAAADGATRKPGRRRAAGRNC